MNQEAFKQELEEVLSKHNENAIQRINKVLNILPIKTKSVYLMVFPSQDGDGNFSVSVNLDGQDLYILNKQIQEYSEIFSPKYVYSEINPYIPTVDPFNLDFEVNDTVANIVVEWLALLWKNVKSENVIIPVYICVDEDYGSTPFIKIK